jgi:hypothetical protein
MVTQKPVQNQVQHCVKLHHRQVADVGQAVDPEQLRSHILHCTSESDTQTVRYWMTRKCPTRARGNLRRVHTGLTQLGSGAFWSSNT